MMKRACKQGGGVCLVALLLAACGGGGGGFTSPGAGNVRALDPAQARTYFAGSTEPGLTASEASDQAVQRLGSIQGSANGSLLVSDISLFTTRDDVSLPSRLNADCTTMTTCGYTVSGASVSIGVTDLSFSGESLRPVMRYRGIPLVSASRSMTRGGLSTEVFGYGGWLDHSGFIVQGETVTSGDARGISGYYGISAGIASNSRPAGGSARWNGVMVATDVSGAGRENVIQGDTALSIDFGADTVDLSFSNVWDLTAGTGRTGTAWSDMPVTVSGTFSGRNAQGETTGRFYGPGHEEAGGTFTYDDLTGAYGLRRQAVPPAPTTPGLNVSQIHSEMEQLVGRIQGSPGRSMLLSDVSLFTARDDLRLPVRLDTTCGMTACNFELLGESSAIDVDGFSLGSAAALRSVTRERGILLTEGAEAIRISGEAPNYPGWIDYSRFPVSGEVGEVFGYGGWLDYSGFLVESVPITSGNARGVSLYYGRSIGIASNSRPAGGSAQWDGVMVATDVSGPGRENVIRGDAALSVDFDAATAGLSFSNVQDLTAGTTRPGTAWIMPVMASGTFSGTNPQGETAGRFYGPGHEEAGGTFTYDDLAGAYGLRRQ